MSGKMKEMRDDVVNFRVKVDLSHFYSDERKLSYVYIDKVRIINVLHLQTRIQSMFGITQPLYLSVDNVFLPANEDIRIIKEDEIVVVQSSFPASKNGTSYPFELSEKIQGSNNTGESISQCVKYGSESTDPEMFNSTKGNDSANDIQIVDSHVVESEGPQRKRKRIRRRKKNSKSEGSPPSSTRQLNDSATTKQQIGKLDMEKSHSKHLKFSWEESDGKDRQGDVVRNPSSSKPVIHSTETTNSKHLKFCWEDPDGKDRQGDVVRNPSSSKPVVRSNETTNLGTLLSLRNSQVPLTFSGQRRIRNNSVASSLSKTSTLNDTPTKKIQDTSVISACSTPISSNVDYSNMNIPGYPIYEDMFEVGDVIAFQTLVLDEAYCPVLSNYIVAKVITNDILAKIYSCKILVGHDQLKSPEGKFALPTDNEEEEKGDTEQLYTLMHSDLNQPRLIHRTTRQ